MLETELSTSYERELEVLTEADVVMATLEAYAQHQQSGKTLLAFDRS